MSVLKNDENAYTLHGILWLDAAANIGEDNRHAQQLRSIVNHLKTFEDKHQFQRYIKSVSPEKRFILIVSGRLVSEVVPHIHHIPQISSIYVYCMDQKRNEQWAKTYSKVKAVTVRMSNLISRIKFEHKNYGKFDDPISISFSSANDNADQATTGLNGHFVQSLLLIDVLLRMKSIESDKQELISLFRKEYQDEDNQATIYKFEKQYTPKDALWWYTYDSFLYKRLNIALRTQDIDLLFFLRFFIRDMYEQLKQNQCPSLVRVYRGQTLSTNEVKNLQKSVNDFISINSFFSTSMDCNEALKFINNSKVPNGKERVLFKINADPRVVTTKPFADISKLSKYEEEEEILFMIGSIFRIENVSQNDDHIWIIQMKLCNDNNHELKNLFDHMKKTYADNNKEITILSFGRVLHQMGKFDLAEKFYRRHLKNLPSNDPSCSDIYYSLGLITLNKGHYDKCLQWFQKALEIKSHVNPPDYSYLGGIYNAIGQAYLKKEEYNQALKSFNKAVDLFKKAHAEERLDMAYLYNNIGLVYQENEKYLEALNYYEKSLVIKGKHLPPTDPSISISHNNIGLIHHSLENYDAALDQYRQALDIQMKSLPAQHPDIAMSYENMGYVYEEQGDWKHALACFKSADAIYEKALSSQHPDTIKNKENIRRISEKLK